MGNVLQCLLARKGSEDDPTSLLLRLSLVATQWTCTASRSEIQLILDMKSGTDFDTLSNKEKIWKPSDKRKWV